MVVMRSIKLKKRGHNNAGFNWNHQSEDNELMIVWRIVRNRRTKDAGSSQEV